MLGWRVPLLLPLVCIVLPGKFAGDAVPFPARASLRPGVAEAIQETGEGGSSVVVLRNNALEARWTLSHGTLQPTDILNKVADVRLPLPGAAFSVSVSADAAAKPEEVSSGSLRHTGAGFRLVRLEPNPEATQPGLAAGGWRVELDLQPVAGGWIAKWSAELRDGSGYLRLSVEIIAGKGPVTMREICLYDGNIPGSRKAGSVDGVPITSSNFFLGFEHPQAKNLVSGVGVARSALNQARLLKPGGSHLSSLVLGVAPSGQVRRAFLHYVERERAHPTRPMLHYNSWYDIGTGQQISAADALDRLDHITRELARRNLTLDAFMLDDGWDDPDAGPWTPHSGFSDASLSTLEDRAKERKTGLGVWFSPFGGYHEPRQRRLAAARRVDIPVREETRERIAAKFRGRGTCSELSPCKEGEGGCQSNVDCEGSLECWHTERGTSPPGIDTSAVQDKSGRVCFDGGVQSAFLGLGIPEYYSHLRDTIVGWLGRGARLLKLDGIGNPSGLQQTLVEDFDAAVKLIAELRKASKKVFINLSTGTWPSPFWLLSSDTVWRRGHDHYFSGPEGPARERWITYRDAMVHQHVVKVSPLFPLNSLMVHGVIYAKDAWDLNRPEGSGEGLSDEPFRHEVRSAFGSGTMLQELYLTPSLLSSRNWDDLAQAAKWVRPRMATLADVQWVGGDPEQGEVYGWAAWRDADDGGAPASAVLTLRNPAPVAQFVQLDATSVFALPEHALWETLVLNTPFDDQRPRQIRLRPGSKTSVHLPPFAVLVYDSEATPPQAWAAWADFILDNSVLLFWAAVAMLVLWVVFRSSGAGNLPSAPAVPLEELRRRRLEALERRVGGGGPTTAATDGLTAEGLRQRGGSMG
mmetsp:Transcript_47790/g.153966  ORF Transcript_47790/g.153966 Transcript_47790/m.153966 type:complete len:864 (+) Transcript_47790:176-2767(+)|eukprot:CAMPEP_0203899054 /NCGR_PEP_ID=MMETSP0359-20131031/41511_1 /ASSEMBLY_ACC=CAM_ASM_000338 /TAXON_ID=268821 /ORGANISM="Scrippsiella Hangoei, Strain SHTV-5" /LENGTH=863 /DNA_ID=CAMNT_0050822233 /DNA_START=100 /DNA_END=2691 /DNA_ORIENTATION=-